MINKNEFDFLNNDLNQYKDFLANCSWGRIQNDTDDQLLRPYNIKSYTELYHKMQHLSSLDKQYASARYYRQKCAECDEFLFSENENVSPNPNRWDHNWDFKINGIEFDLKGTTLFKNMTLEEALANPEKLLQRYYNEQSPGVRNGSQNRIFLIHYSKKPVIENKIPDFWTNLLRCQFDKKKLPIANFVKDFEKIQQTQKFNIEYQGTKPLAYFLLIVEEEDGTITYKY